MMCLATQVCHARPSQTAEQCITIAIIDCIPAVKSEVDNYNEWYYDTSTNELCLTPNVTFNMNDDKTNKYLQNTTFAIGNLSCVFDIDGGRNITMSNINFRDARYTYMDNKWETPSGGDWCTYYGGAIYVQTWKILKY